MILSGFAGLGYMADNSGPSVVYCSMPLLWDLGFAGRKALRESGCRHRVSTLRRSPKSAVGALPARSPNSSINQKPRNA